CWMQAREWICAMGCCRVRLWGGLAGGVRRGWRAAGAGRGCGGGGRGGLGEAAGLGAEDGAGGGAAGGGGGWGGVRESAARFWRGDESRGGRHEVSAPPIRGGGQTWGRVGRRAMTGRCRPGKPQGPIRA